MIAVFDGLFYHSLEENPPRLTHIKVHTFVLVSAYKQSNSHLSV